MLSQHTGKLESISAATEQFEQALELAKQLDDLPSQEAIKKAMEELNTRSTVEEQSNPAPQEENSKTEETSEAD